MNEDYKQVLIELSEIKTKIAIADYFINTVKSQDLDSMKKIETVKQQLNSLDAKLCKDLDEFKIDINKQINTIEFNLSSINSKIDNVSNNSFLIFTNNLDPKKWATIVSIIISFMLGNGVIDNVISDTVDLRKENINQNVEKLVNELLIEQKSLNTKQEK